MDTDVARTYSSYKPNPYSSANRLPRNTENNMHNSHAIVPPKENYIYPSGLSDSVKSNQSSDSIESNESASTAGVLREPEYDSTVKDGINSVNIQEELQAGRERVEFEKKNSLDGRSDDQVSGTRRLEEQGCLNFFTGFKNCFHRPPEANLEALNIIVVEGINKIYAIKQHNKGKESKDVSNDLEDINKKIENKDVSNELKDINKKIENIVDISYKIIMSNADYNIAEEKIKRLNEPIMQKGSQDKKKLETDTDTFMKDLLQARDDLLQAREYKKDFLKNMREAVKKFRAISINASKYGEDALSYIDKLAVCLDDFRIVLNDIKENTSFNNRLDQIEKLHLELVAILKEKYKQVEKQVVSLYEKEKKEYDSMLAKQPSESFTHKQDVVLKLAEYSLLKSISCPRF